MYKCSREPTTHRLEVSALSLTIGPTGSSQLYPNLAILVGC